MNDILHEYTAGEFIEWAINQDLTALTEDKVVETEDGDTAAVTQLSEEKLVNGFIKSVCRFSIVKRGYTLYIHNNERCEDIMQLKFTDSTYEDVQKTATQLCNSLNNREINFVGKKKHCC